MPVMPSMLSSYLELIPDSATSSSIAAPSASGASQITANPIPPTTVETDLAISSALSDDQVRLALAGDGKSHDNPSPDSPILRTPERVKEAFDNCIRANLRTEFDTAETLLARSEKAPCRFGGVATYRGRGDELAGDILKYDPERQITYWDIPLRDNVRYGQIALPYDLPFGLGGNKKEFTKEQKAEVKAMTKTSFLILPLYGEKDVAGTYEAANGFGAKATVISLSGVRYSLGVNMGKQRMVGESFRVASAPLPRDKAPDLIPNLDVQLYWMAAKPCEHCLSGGQADTGTIGGPTFSNPQDVNLVQNYVFARLVAIHFVDRRDGKTYAISTGD